MRDADELAAGIAALAAEYREKLAARLDALDALAAQLASGRAADARLKDLHRELHMIAGSAKTFGLPAVSAAARAGEHYLEPFCETDAAPSAVQWETLIALLAALRESAASA